MFNAKNNIIIPFEKKVWLSSPTMHGEELGYVNEAYNTNWMSTVGKNIDEVEKEIAEKIGVKYAVALSSGTSALHLAVKLANIKREEKIFCSDLTFAATVNPIVYEGAEPIFIDSEYDTWNMDPDALCFAFQNIKNVKVVVLTNLYGTPSKIEEIKNIASEFGAILIEDAAESLGSCYKNIQTGSFGDIGCISFNGNKIITGSSGGMLLTNDINKADEARKLSTQARENAAWYQHNSIGYNYRMSNVIAGVVRGQIPYLNDHISRKREIYERYKTGFSDLPVKMNPYDEENSTPNFWLSCIIIDKEYMCFQKRSSQKAEYIPEHGKSCPSEILDALSKYNAEGRPIWKPMHMQPVFCRNEFVTKDKVYSSGIESLDHDFGDVGADIFSRGLCLPSDIKMSFDEQDRIIEIVRACFN